jgi:hypothetical protein
MEARVRASSPDRPIRCSPPCRGRYRPEPGDPVLFGPTCLVAGCRARGLLRADGLRGHLCDAHARMWRRDGQPPQEGWLPDEARPLRYDRLAAAGCVAVGCRRSAAADVLCKAHDRHWKLAGKPPLDTFVVSAPKVRTGVGECRVGGCSFAPVRGGKLCDAHHKSYMGGG